MDGTPVITDNDLWRALEGITAWLDDANRELPGDDEMRIMKLGEEIGEAREAVEGYFAAIQIGYGRVVSKYLGATGQNPRKGVTHTMDDVLDELADIAGTALSAIQHFTGNIDETREILIRKFVYMAGRAGVADPE